ncbi:MAG: dihydroorotate dehydrogenase (quinone), partial [Bacteroidota bacterium]
MYKYLLKPFLFRLSAERAHYFTVQLFRVVLAIPGMKVLYRSLFEVKDERLKRQLFGLEFPNPVGLAAGFDKDGKFYDAMQYLGFGFIEIGTVTPKPQVGNP